ncbi:MAG: C25 family cysteine peptidase [Acidobacteriota bacterium]
MLIRRLLAGTALVLAGATAQAQLAQNGVASGAFTWTTGTPTATIAHTTPNLANRFMIVAVHMNIENSTGSTVAGVTYAGAPMALTTAISDGGAPNTRTELWGLIAPTTGANNVVVTLQNITAGQSVQGVVGVTTYVDVDPLLTGSLPHSGVGNDTAPTSTLAGSAAGDMVVDFTTIRQTNAGTQSITAVGGGQTTMYNNVSSPAPLNNDDIIAVSSRETSTGANVTMSYTAAASARWSKAGASLRGAITDVSITGYATPDVVDGTPTNVTFTFTITAESAGANNVDFSFPLPAGYSIVSANSTLVACTAAATSTCNDMNLLTTGGTATVTIVATSPYSAVGTATGTATITVGTPDSLAGNNSAAVSVRTESRVCATPGKDGIAGTISSNPDTYYPGTANAAAGATSITVGAVPAGYGTAAITAGDLLLVMQMQDAAIDSSNNDRYGSGAGNAGTSATVGTSGSGSSNLNNAGRFEYVVAVTGVTTAGGTFTVTGAGATNGLLYAYTNAAASGTQGQRRFQVIRVPQYSTATIAAGTSAPAWNGTVGGVLAIDVSGTITMGSNAGAGTVATTNGSPTVTGTGSSFLTQIRSGDTINIQGQGNYVVLFVNSATQLTLTSNATATATGRTYTVPHISVSGRGFRGGAGRQLAGGAGANTDYRTLATNAANGSKAEGIAGTPRYVFQGTGTPLDTGVEGYPNGSYGRGAPGNAGGGGTDGEIVTNQQNTGGGGGGNGGQGGKGGNAWNNVLALNGGFGGNFESPSPTRVIMGGGGGAGTTNNGTQQGSVNLGTNGINSSGVAGGGIVFIRANAITGTGTIASNGAWAIDVGNDSGGGGGAGGTIVIQTQYGVLTSLSAEAKGGRGGDAWLTQANPCSNPTCPPNATDYPGERHGPGGGGGGGAIYLTSAVASTTVTGGANGVTTLDNDTFGATGGANGIVLISATSPTPGVDTGFDCAIANLVVTNTDAPDPVTAGSNITYSQTLTNAGPNTADQVTFSTSVPASATFVSMTPPAGWSCITPIVGGTGPITCTTASLANGASANFTFVANTNAGTPAGYIVSNTANATAQTNDSNYANNTATATTTVITPAFADIRVTITAPATVVANTNYNYTQTVSNGGGASAANPSFSENTPPNTTFQGITPPAGWSCITPVIGGTGAITCTSATPLAAGASVNIPMTLRVNAGTPNGTVVTETATVSTSTTDSNSSNNSSSVSTTVVAAGSADFGTTITALNDPVPSGGFVSFSEVVTNNGVTAANATYTQNVPANTTFQSLTVPAGWSCVTPAVGGTGAITCTTTGVAAVGSSFTFIPTYKVNTGTVAGTVITDTVTVTAAVADSVAGNNTASATSTVQVPSNADLAITKTDSPDPIGVGQLITYLLRVVNNGPEIATGVTTSDTLPGTVTFISSSPSQGTCSGTSTVSCSLGTLAVNGTATVSIVVQANSTGTINNTATVSGAVTDPVAANNSSSTSTTVLAVTLVHLRDLIATQDKDKVLLTWQTTFESDNLGFNLYREVGGVRTKLNKGLIAGSALVGKKQDKNAGHGYRFRDKLANGTFAQYWLEDVDMHGVHTLHGPVSPVTGNADAPANTTPLAGLGASGTVLASPAGFGVVQTLTLGDISAGQIKQQQDLAADAGLKIFVTEEGWQRVTKAAMVAAGYDPGTNGDKISLFSAGIEQQITVDDGGDNKFDATDTVEFYGLPLDTRSTGARTYWLRSKGGNNRVKLSKGKGGDPVTGSVPFTVQRIDRNIFAAAVTNVEENFFGPLIFADWETPVDITVAGIDSSYGGDANLEVTLQGGTDGAIHLVGVTFAGHSLGTVSLPRAGQQTFSFPVPHSWVANGPNTVSFTALNGWDDLSLLVEVRLTYQHVLRADSGALEVNLPGGRAATIGGFGNARVRAIDITDPQRPIEMETSVAADPQGGFAATFATPSDSATRTILAFDSTRSVTPQEVVANRPSSWSASSTKGAELVVVSNPAFTAAAAVIEPARKAQGISTVIVDVDDVYDEFNFGIRDPQAIRNFMQNAAQWKTAPRWLMLVGDASIDPRNYLEMGSADFMPTKLVTTTPLMAPMDDWFTDFNGDGIAEVPVGRIPVRTADDAARIFNRLASRGTPSGTWSNSALFVADNPGDYDFADAAASAAALLPPSFSTQSIGVNHGDIVSAMNAGQLIVDYIGHGSTEIWSSPGVFHSSDAAALTNGTRLPLLVGMTCLNGYFHDVYTESLAEALMKAPNGGAIAVWTSSSLTQPDQQSIMNRELFRQLFGGASITLGEAITRAKAAVSDPDVRKSWVLFGDPSMRLK